jgi:hypothetical protein
MRSSVLVIPIMLLAAPVVAIELGAPTDTSRVPVTQGAIMGAAKAAVPLSVAENPFAGARVLSDAEIALLIFTPYPILAKPGTPRIMAVAKRAVGAVE